MSKMLENVSLYHKWSISVELSNGLQLRRIRAVSNKSRELPPVSMGHSVEDFFDVVLRDTKAGTKLPN